MGGMKVDILKSKGKHMDREGAHMSIAREMEKDKADGKGREALKCFSCGIKLKSESEGVRSGRTVLCTSCYETCLNPLPKLCCAVS
jgi:hypothetical protein